MFYQFTLEQDIDYNDTTFAVNVIQQGNRLKNSKLLDESKKFEASRFSICLIKDGEIVKAKNGTEF